MHPTELHLFFAAKRPQKQYAGGMSEDDVASLYKRTYGKD